MINIKLHVITPLHIGSDEIYEPFSFVIDEQRKVLIEFDQLSLADILSKDELDALAKVAGREDILGIYKMLRNLYLKYKNKFKGYEIPIPQALVSRYLEIVGLPLFDNRAKNEISKFEISKTAFNPNNKTPYIPGSSIKGSIRTAYLNWLAKQKKISHFPKSSEELETELLGRKHGREKMASDPFRMLKISDFIPESNVKKSVLYAVNRKREVSNRESAAQKRGLHQMLEVLVPGSIFKGTLKLEIPQRGAGILNPIPNYFLKTLNSFYLPLLEQEAKFLRYKGQTVDYFDKIKAMLEKNAYLIRLGKHSGAEAVTIEGYRKIRVRTNRGSEEKTAPTTLWLASTDPKGNSTLGPFGWAVLEVMNG
ncbi:type III-A CRISPR-associated RAMP protein Csm5 [Thermodesulfovibrio hydrogeniphilus]